MDIEAILRAEIKRRGLTPTDVSRGAKIPFTTASEFIRKVRVIGADKASKIATFLGFSLVENKPQTKKTSKRRLIKIKRKKG